MANETTLEKTYKLKWSYEMETMLIDEVEKKNFLWNTKNDLFKIRSLKRVGFQEITEILKVEFPAQSAWLTVDSVMNRFSNLRTVFQRNFKKWKTLKTKTGSERFSLSWVHFDRMLFLEDSEEVTESGCILMPIIKSEDSCGALTFIMDETQVEEHNPEMLDSTSSNISLLPSRDSHVISSNAGIVNEKRPLEEHVEPDSQPQVSRVYNLAPKRKRIEAGESEDEKYCGTFRSSNNQRDSVEDAIARVIALRLKELDEELRNKKISSIMKLLFD